MPRLNVCTCNITIVKYTSKVPTLSKFFFSIGEKTAGEKSSSS